MIIILKKDADPKQVESLVKWLKDRHITPNISTKPRNVPNSTGMPCINIKATAQAVIFMALPDKWIVAHSGTTNPATPSRTPLSCVCFNVTGIVAALLDVPNAVK